MLNYQKNMKTTLKTITSGPPRDNGLHPHPAPGARHTLLSLGPGFGPSSGKGLAIQIAQLLIFLGETHWEISRKLPTDFWHIFGKLLVENVHESCLLTMHFIFSRHFLFHAFSPQFGQQQTTPKNNISRLRGGQQQHSIFFAHCRTVRCCALGILV